MKKFFAALVLSFLLAPLAAASFSDVSEGYRYHASITYLEENGIIQGYDDGTFMPDQDVTRAEALKIILLGSGIDVSEQDAYELPFSDLVNDAWYLSYIARGYELEIVEGYDDGTFMPEQTVNLAEALKIITLATDAELPEVTESPYDDVPADVWYASYAQYAKDLNLIEPEDDGLLHPDQTVSRAELSEIMYRLMYIEEHGLEEFDISLNWQSYQNELGYEVKYPYDWQILTISDGGVVLWNKDEGHNQAGFDRQYPNSASVSIFVHENSDGLDSGEFFAEIIELADYGDDVVFEELTVNGLYALQVYYERNIEPIMDMYVYMPNDAILVMYGSHGNGALAEHSHDQVYGIEVSAVYVEDAVTSVTEWEEILEEARSLIMVEEMGTYVLQLFDDRYLIETDTIGVGTGPVDYYYSAGGDVTLKYERSFDMILDVADGSTTAF